MLVDTEKHMLAQLDVRHRIMLQTHHLNDGWCSSLDQAVRSKHICSTMLRLLTHTADDARRTFIENSIRHSLYAYTQLEAVHRTYPRITDRQ